MDPARKLEIHELLSRAAYCFDERDLDNLERCFSEDAHMLVRIADGRVFGPFEGREAIMGLMKTTLDAQTDTRRHVISNLFFENAGEDEATVVSTLVVFSAENDAIRVVTSGVYRDAVQCRDGRWQVARRVLELETGF